jgi:methionine-rich copper-binding protein CopC
VSALLLTVAPAVSAHTLVVSTIPADGVTLELSPRLVGVIFNDAIQQERSSIVVLDASGATIAEGELTRTIRPPGYTAARQR